MTERNAPTGGTLFVVPTPIGNLEDITLRALRVLREAHFVAAEDTRHSRKLLTHFDIHPPQLFSYHEHNVRESGQRIVELLLQGATGALVSDAGMPGISDPGHDIIALLTERGIPVVVLPGPSAFVTGLVGSGLATDKFTFYGFFPRESKAQRILVDRLRDATDTSIFYESPVRLHKTMQLLVDQLDDRAYVIARELTKVHEEYIRGKLSMYTEIAADIVRKGEIVILLGGASQAVRDVSSAVLDADTIALQVQQLVALGVDRKDAMRQVGKSYGVTRRDVYQLLLHGDETGV